MNKKLIGLLAIVLLLISGTVQAGLFGKLVKGAIVGGIGYAAGSHAAQKKIDQNSQSSSNHSAKSNKITSQRQEEQKKMERLKKMNKYAWRALKKRDLQNSKLKMYLAELEETYIIGMVDTAAFGQAVLGDKERGVTIYKEKIIPYLEFESHAIQKKYKRAYGILLKCKPSECMNQR